MKSVPRHGRHLHFILALALPLSLASHAANAAEPASENSAGLDAQAMARLSLTQRTLAALLLDAKVSLGKGQAASEVAKTFYTELGALGFKNPPLELSRLKARLNETGLSNEVLGAPLPTGGTPVECALLRYHRDLTLDCIRDALREVAGRYDDASGKLYVGKASLWDVQRPESFTLASDFNFSFLGSNSEVILALRDAYTRLVKERLGLQMLVLAPATMPQGSVVEHFVYLSQQPLKIPEGASIPLSGGIERVLLASPDSFASEGDNPETLTATPSSTPTAGTPPPKPAASTPPASVPVAASTNTPPVAAPVAVPVSSKTSPSPAPTPAHSIAPSPAATASVQPAQPTSTTKPPLKQQPASPDTQKFIAAARAEAIAAERKRDFDTAEKIYLDLEHKAPGDPSIARALGALAGFRQTLGKLRDHQRTVTEALTAKDLDAANAAINEARKLEPSLPGPQSAETASLTQKIFQAQKDYLAEIGPKRFAVTSAYSANKLEDASRLLTELTRSRPLRKDDAAWAKTMEEQIAKRIQQTTTKGPAQIPAPVVTTRPASTPPVPAPPVVPIKPVVKAATTPPLAPQPAPVAPQAASTLDPAPTYQSGTLPAPSTTASSAPKNTPPSSQLALPSVSGKGGDFSAGLGTLWAPISAAGGDFTRHARFEGGALIVDVPANSSWGKTGLVCKEPSFILGDEPVAVKVSLDPERTSGFGVAFASGAYQDVWGYHNIWFTCTRPASQLHSNFWFGNAQNAGDGFASEALAGQAPSELIFVLRPGFAEVHLPDGRVFSSHPAWLKKGTPIFTHVFSHPNEHQLPAKLALRSVTWGSVPNFPAPVSSVPKLGSRSLWTGDLSPVWTPLQAVGGDYAQFARVENRELVINVPAGRSWGKTGIFSPERLFTLNERPVNVVVRVDPIRSSGFAVVFAPGGYHDVWGYNNLWLTYTRPSSQVHGDIWFGNTQNKTDTSIAEQVSGTAPYELVFTLTPGRAELRLPDGRVRVVNIGWLKKDTPVFGHVFTHPNEHQLPSRLALKSFDVGIGEMPPSRPVPASAKQPDKGQRSLWTGEVGGLWAPLSAAGGDYPRHARLVGKELIVDVPANSGWGKAGVLTPERILTIGDKPFTVTTRIDPSRTSGYVVAFAPGAYPDVWGYRNAWFSWVGTTPGKENFYGGNTQGATDTSFSLVYPGTTAPATMQFTFRAGGGGLDCRLPDGSSRTYNFAWMTKGTPIYLHIFSHPVSNGQPARMVLQGVEVQSEFTWPPAR